MSQAQTAFRVLVVDDHATLTDIFVLFLGAQPGIEVVGAVSSAAAALAHARADHPDLVILDLNLPDRHGLDLVPDLQALDPWPKIVVLTGIDDPRVLAEALDSGIDGLVMKSARTDDLLAALAAVRAGGRYVSPAVEARVAGLRGAVGELTSREREVLALIARGATSAAIAQTLGCAESTVEKHRANLLRKLGAATSAELGAIAVRRGLAGTI